MKLLFSKYLGDYSYSFQGSSELISITVKFAQVAQVKQALAAPSLANLSLSVPPCCCACRCYRRVDDMGNGKRTTAQAGTCGGIPGGTLQRRASAKAPMAKRWQTKATERGQEYGPRQGQVAEADNNHQREARDQAQGRDCLLSLPHWQLADEQRLPHMRRQARMDATSQNHADADRQSTRMAHPQSRGRDQQEQRQASPEQSDPEHATHQRCRRGHRNGKRFGALCHVERDRPQSRTRTPTGSPHTPSQQYSSYPADHEADWASQGAVVCLQKAGTTAGHGGKDCPPSHSCCAESPRGHHRAREKDSAAPNQTPGGTTPRAGSTTEAYSGQSGGCGSCHHRTSGGCTRPHRDIGQPHQGLHPTRSQCNGAGSNNNCHEPSPGANASTGQPHRANRFCHATGASIAVSPRDTAADTTSGTRTSGGVTADTATTAPASGNDSRQHSDIQSDPDRSGQQPLGRPVGWPMSQMRLDTRMQNKSGTTSLTREAVESQLDCPMPAVQAPHNLARPLSRSRRSEALSKPVETFSRTSGPSRSRWGAPLVHLLSFPPLCALLLSVLGVCALPWTSSPLCCVCVAHARYCDINYAKLMSSPYRA